MPSAHHRFPFPQAKNAFLIHQHPKRFFSKTVAFLFGRHSGDDCQSLIWDLSSVPSSVPKAVEDPILAYTAEEQVNQLQWSASHPEWIAIAFANKLQILRVWLRKMDCTREAGIFGASMHSRHLWRALMWSLKGRDTPLVLYARRPTIPFLFV